MKVKNKIASTRTSNAYTRTSRAYTSAHRLPSRTVDGAFCTNRKRYAVGTCIICLIGSACFHVGWLKVSPSPSCDVKLAASLLDSVWISSRTGLTPKKYGLPLSEPVQKSLVSTRSTARPSSIAPEVTPPFTKTLQTFVFGDKHLEELFNSSCTDGYAVPPIVHFIWLTLTRPFKLHEYIAVTSVDKFQKPCYILFHCDVARPSGKWWDRLVREVTNIIFVQHKLPSTIFGKPFGFIEHQADVLRLQILMAYGGIYLDTDVYLLRSYDPLRNHTLTLSRESPSTVANGIILANKKSQLVKTWYLNYHDYDRNSWAKNSVFMAKKLCEKMPKMVNLETKGIVLLGSNYRSVYEENIRWEPSRYSVHLYARFADKAHYEIEDIKQLNTTFGALSRYVLFGSPDLVTV